MKVLSKELSIDLILLDFSRFAEILGMDWLENYCTVIDCSDKIITLRSPKINNLITMGSFVL